MVIETPIELLESLAYLRFPPQADAMMQRLMDRNTHGQLSNSERDELEGLVALSESMSLIRARVLKLLGQNP